MVSRKIAEDIRRTIKSIFGKGYHVELVGSFLNRKKQELGDVDILISNKDIKTKEQIERIKPLEKIQYHWPEIKIDTLTPERLFGYAGSIKLNILFTPYDNYIEFKFSWTGGAKWQIVIIKLLKDKGFRFGQTGLFKGDERIPITNELEIFKYADIPHKNIKDRYEI